MGTKEGEGEGDGEGFQNLEGEGDSIIQVGFFRYDARGTTVLDRYGHIKDGGGQN